MADDRMAIVCKKCNLGIAIAKRYLGSNWYVSGSRGRDHLNAFFDKHEDCFNGHDYGDQYRLGYEREDDWEYDNIALDNHKE